MRPCLAHIAAMSVISLVSLLCLCIFTSVDCFPFQAWAGIGATHPFPCLGDRVAVTPILVLAALLPACSLAMPANFVAFYECRSFLWYSLAGHQHTSTEVQQPSGRG
jgi:hypothetical protein